VDVRELRRAYVAWAAVCFFWGTTYLAIHIGMRSLPPALFGGLRILSAGLVLAAWLRFRGQALPQGRDWLHLAVVGLALLGCGNGILNWAAQWAPSGGMALMIAMTPFWMIGLEALMPGGDRFTPRALVGLLLGLAGLALLMAPRLQGAAFEPRVVWALLSLQGCCATWAIGSVYARRHPVDVPPLMGAAIQMVVAGAAMTLLGTLSGEWPRFRFTPESLGAFLYLLFFGSIVGYGSYIYALQKLPISTVSLYSYVNPVIAVFLGWAVLHERVSWPEVLAVGVILSGVAVVKTAPSSSAPKPSPLDRTRIAPEPSAE